MSIVSSGRNEINEEEKIENESQENNEKSYFSEEGKLKPNENYEVNGYKYETDGLGRIKRCEGNLTLKPGERNPAAQKEAGGEDRHTGDGVEYDLNDKDDGGHLIATRFNGSGEIDNLVAQNYKLNRSEYKKMENEWAKTLEETNEKGEQKYDVHVDIKPVYRSESQRPDAFIIKEEVTDRESGETVSRQTRRFNNEYSE